MNYFKSKREESNLSRNTAAEQLGISWFHLRNIETGQKYPGKGLILKMCDVYGCDLLEMLKESQKILA